MPAVLLSNVNLLKSPEKFNIGIQDLKYYLSTTSWKKSIPRQTGKQFLIWGPDFAKLRPGQSGGQA